MGDFAAYNFNRQYEPTLTVNDNARYFRRILSFCNIESFVATDQAGALVVGHINDAGDRQVVTPVDVAGIDAAGQPRIEQRNPAVPGLPLSRIAREEQRYYYRWLEGEPPSVDQLGDDVPRFARIDVLGLSVVDAGQLLAGVQARSGQPPARVLAALQTELTKIRQLLYLDDKTVKVSTHLALYVDTNDATASFRWAAAAGGTFRKLRVWRPAQAKREALDPTNPRQCEYFEAHNGCNDEGAYTDDVVSRRELCFLWNEFNERAELPPKLRKFGAIFSDWDAARITRQMKRLIEQLGSAEIKRAITDAAANAVRTLPPGFRCFYYCYTILKVRVLDGFLSDASTAFRSGGSGGYEMRADPVDEHEYMWRPSLVTAEGARWGRQIARVIGLDPGGWAGNIEGTPDGFSETNTPFVIATKMREAPDHFPAPRVAQDLRLLRYFKKMRPIVKRRNRPPQPRPSKDMRMEHKGYLATDALFLRWKKGEDFQGVGWGLNMSPRAQAGAVMAKALKVFAFYPAAMESCHPRITVSSLPATCFAEFVFATAGLDGDAEPSCLQSLRDDGRGGRLTPVRADQEWCHLFGHGDGGEEELENFVCGSQHCNTEQLAIETGQRRVTQYKAIPLQTRQNFSWKVTAHLLDNQGSRIANLAAVLNSYLPSAALPDDVKQEMIGLAQSAPDKFLQTLTETIKQRSREPSAVIELTRLLRWYHTNCGVIFPLATCIHYRIQYKNDKCFEHYLDAQSESFDVNEAKILDYTVERELYRALHTDPGASVWNDELQRRERPWLHYLRLLQARVGQATIAGRKRPRDDDPDPRNPPPPGKRSRLELDPMDES